MITMTVKTDTVFDPEVRDRVLYFNLEKPEIVEMLKDHPKMLAVADAMRNGAAAPIDVWEFLNILVLRAYGKRVNGDEFLKNDDVRNAFRADKPYAALMDELLGDQDASKAIDFMTKIMPAGSIEAARAKLDEEDGGKARPVAPQDHLPKSSPRREAQERILREGETSISPHVGG